MAETTVVGKFQEYVYRASILRPRWPFYLLYVLVHQIMYMGLSILSLLTPEHPTFSFDK